MSCAQEIIGARGDLASHHRTAVHSQYLCSRRFVDGGATCARRCARLPHASLTHALQHVKIYICLKLVLLLCCGIKPPITKPVSASMLLGRGLDPTGVSVRGAQREPGTGLSSADALCQVRAHRNSPEYMLRRQLY